MSLGVLMRVTPTKCFPVSNAPVPTTNQAVSSSRLCYYQTMTIGITGPEQWAPRRNAVVGIIIAATVVGILLILLGLAADFLVDWLWFSSIGYLQVFLTTFGAKAAVFFSVWVATAIVLLLNGFLAGESWPAAVDPASCRVATPGRCDFAQSVSGYGHRLSWPRVIAGGAGLLAVLVAAAEVSNWNLFCGCSIRCPMGQTIRSTPRTSASISFRCPPTSLSRTGCCSPSSKRVLRRSDLLGARRHRI